MKKILLICFLQLVLTNADSQSISIRDYNLEVYCVSRVHNSSTSILDFRWKNPPPTARAQRVYRKSKTAYTWGSAYRTLNMNDTTFSDTITTGSHFEYRFEKDTGRDGYSVQGYIYAGHRVLPIKQRGTLLLIIDSTHRVFLANDLRTFRNDLTGDGWFTKVLWVSPSTSVSTIKSFIVSEYNANPTQVKSVCLIGDVAVPYSGNFSSSGIFPPDGHTTFSAPSHEGAWPADVYYGDVNSSSWTDNTVTNNAGARAANNNNPSDGKFDQTSLPTLIELGVGRIDLSNFTSFTETERELLRRYFKKNHDYKHLNFTTVPRCLIDDNFGLLNYPYPNIDEHFAGNAYRNTAPLINKDSCFNLDYLSTLNTKSYQWSYGFGAGGYSSVSGVSNTSQMASSTQELKTVFTGLFGSYFGDWDNTNNLLRAPLAAKGHALNSFWVGRPHWFFHHMGLGETIGYSTMRTQYNYDTTANYLLYPTTAFSYLQIHPALMGDPTTRLNVVEPISDFVVKQDSCNQRFKLSWTEPTDTAVNQYLIFRAKHIDSTFVEIGTTANQTFTDSFPLTGNNVYMVRGMKLQVNNSGTYFNLSQGLFDTISYSIPLSNVGFDTSYCLNNTVTLGYLPSQNNSYTSYLWMPNNVRTPTLTTTITGNESKYLTIKDTLSGCIVKDTLNISALSLPVQESINLSYNFCNDSLLWSCTNLNPSSYIYTWNFEGGNPNDSVGSGLINPGLVVYPNTGTYEMVLTITNPSNNCFVLDTSIHNVTCTSLSLDEVDVKCSDNSVTVQLKEEYVNKYHQLSLYGLFNNDWVYIESIKTMGASNYVFNINNTFSDYQIRGIENGDLTETELGECSSNKPGKQVTVYPIPFHDLLQLQFNRLEPFRKSYLVEIMSYDGKIVYHQYHNELLLTLKLNDLIKGAYLIRIIDQYNIQTFKINKQ